MSRIIGVRDVMDMVLQEYRDHLQEKLAIFGDVGGERRPIVGSSLKVRHAKTGLMYTVDTLTPDDITLRTPEGELFTLPHDEFEAQYELD